MVKKPKHKHRRLAPNHRSHVKSRDWRGFYKRNWGRWNDNEPMGTTAIEEEAGYLGVYEKRFMSNNK